MGVLRLALKLRDPARRMACLAQPRFRDHAPQRPNWARPTVGVDEHARVRVLGVALPQFNHGAAHAAPDVACAAYLIRSGASGLFSGEDAPPDPLCHGYRHGVSAGGVAGAVGLRIDHPSGKPWSLSHSVGVRRRTEEEGVGGVAVGVLRVSPDEGWGDDATDIVASGAHMGSDGACDERRASPCPVLAGVEALGPESVSDKVDIVLFAASGVADPVGVSSAGEGGGDEVPSCGFLGSNPVSASAARASRKGRGNSLARFSARRKIPAAALGLKKNRSGTVSNSTSGNDEDTSPPLGHSEVSAVQHSPGEVVKPDVGQRRENDREVPSVSSSARRGK